MDSLCDNAPALAQLLARFDGRAIASRTVAPRDPMDEDAGAPTTVDLSGEDGEDGGGGGGSGSSSSSSAGGAWVQSVREVRVSSEEKAALDRVSTRRGGGALAARPLRSLTTARIADVRAGL